MIRGRPIPITVEMELPETIMYNSSKNIIPGTKKRFITAVFNGKRRKRVADFIFIDTNLVVRSFNGTKIKHIIDGYVHRLTILV